jgi:hypothetical protein
MGDVMKRASTTTHTHTLAQKTSRRPPFLDTARTSFPPVHTHNARHCPLDSDASSVGWLLGGRVCVMRDGEGGDPLAQTNRQQAVAHTNLMTSILHNTPPTPSSQSKEERARRRA